MKHAVERSGYDLFSMYGSLSLVFIGLMALLVYYQFIGIIIFPMIAVIITYEYIFHLKNSTDRVTQTMYFIFGLTYCVALMFLYDVEKISFAAAGVCSGLIGLFTFYMEKSRRSMCEKWSELNEIMDRISREVN